MKHCENCQKELELPDSNMKAFCSGKCLAEYYKKKKEFTDKKEIN